MNGFNIINITSLSPHCSNTVKCAKCQSNDSTALICVKFVCHHCPHLLVTFSLAVCTCLICLYIQPAVCIVTAKIFLSKRKYFWARPPEILDRDYLIEHIMVQNFAAIGRQSSEISQLKNNFKNTAKYKSVTKAIASRQTYKPIHQQCRWNEWASSFLMVCQYNLGYTVPL